jgi:hypothetical protein
MILAMRRDLPYDVYGKATRLTRTDSFHSDNAADLL